MTTLFGVSILVTANYSYQTLLCNKQYVQPDFKVSILVTTVAHHVDLCCLGVGHCICLLICIDFNFIELFMYRFDSYRISVRENLIKVVTPLCDKDHVF